MPVTGDFDRFFLHLPPLDREEDFDTFWKNSLSELKKIPIEPSFTPVNTARSPFNKFEVTFSGMFRSSVSGSLLVPSNARKPRAVIIIHDYNRPDPYAGYPLDGSIAYFFLRLRGHGDMRAVEPEKSPGYMADSIGDAAGYYMRGVYLDAYRAIDVLRLNDRLDCSAIGFMGKGLGGAAAVFAAANSSRPTALVLDTPSFAYLPESQNVSTGEAAVEINEYLSLQRTKKKLIKKNLSYFDAINFTDRVAGPALFTVGFKDTISPPQCVFALFNHLRCEKTIEVYPDDGNDAGGAAQFEKSIRWLIEFFDGL
ncbi:MAG TPA: acetylxylan esterase [Spirochaetota bacterium]|nr:acetylxylan esterase [Spirochaetota bacterium]